MTQDNSIQSTLALTGAGIGAYAGYKKAPSVLGKVNVDAILNRELETDIVRDKIFRKMGEATKDTFEKFRGTWLNAEHIPSNSVKYIFENVPHSGDSIAVKSIKEFVSKTDFTTDGISDVKNYLEGLSKLDENAKLTKDELKKVFTKSHRIYQNAKQDIENIIKKAPKKTGQYALIGAVVAGIGAYLIGNIISPMLHKNKTKNV